MRSKRLPELPIRREGGEDFKVLKKISEKDRAFRIVNERGQLDQLRGGPSSGCDLLINT